MCSLFKFYSNFLVEISAIHEASNVCARRSVYRANLVPKERRDESDFLLGDNSVISCFT